MTAAAEPLDSFAACRAAGHAIQRCSRCDYPMCVPCEGHGQRDGSIICDCCADDDDARSDAFDYGDGPEDW